MKKIAFLMLIISVLFSIISCSGSSGGDTEEGYVDPGDWSGKDVKLNKAYTLAGGSCAASAQCNAIIYQNRLNNTDYVGIAVNNAHAATPPTYSVKIYWQADTIPIGNGLTLLSCNARINDQSRDNFDITNVDISVSGDIYTITFTTEFSVGTASINAGNSINAVKYP